MEGPPLGPGGEDITWPDQVAPRGRKASSTRKIKPQTSNPSCRRRPQEAPTGGSASPEGNISKKRRLAWMAKSLMAAGVDVKCPDEQ